MTAPTPEELRSQGIGLHQTADAGQWDVLSRAVLHRTADALLAAAEEIERLDAWIVKYTEDSVEERDRLRAELAEACELLAEAREDRDAMQPELTADGEPVVSGARHHFRCQSTWVRGWGPCDCWVGSRDALLARVRGQK